MQYSFDRDAGNWTATTNDHFDLLITGRIKGAEAQVLLMLIRFTQGWQGYGAGRSRNGNAYFAEVNLSYSRIREATGIAENHLTKAVKNLIRKGLVVLVRRGGGASSNRYALNYDRSEWELEKELPAITPTQDLYEDCRRTSDLEVRAIESSPDLEGGGGPDLEVRDTPYLEGGGKSPQSPATTEVEPNQRNSKKSKDTTPPKSPSGGEVEEGFFVLERATEGLMERFRREYWPDRDPPPSAVKACREFLARYQLPEQFGALKESFGKALAEQRELEARSGEPTRYPLKILERVAQHMDHETRFKQCREDLPWVQ